MRQCRHVSVFKYGCKRKAAIENKCTHEFELSQTMVLQLYLYTPNSIFVWYTILVSALAEVCSVQSALKIKFEGDIYILVVIIRSRFPKHH